MRCPKCDSPMPIGGKVCKNCNFNAITNQYENAPVRPVQQPVRQAPVQQPVSRPAPQRPVTPPAQAPQRPAVNPTPAPRPVQQTAPVQQPPQTTQKPRKKKGNWFVRFALCFLAVIIGRTVGYFAGQLMAKDWNNDTPGQNSSYQQSPAPSTEKTINPAYTALLEKYGITYTEKTSSMNSTCLVHEEDGVLYMLELGYWQDVVNEEVDTFYYPLDTYDEELIKTNIEANLNQMYPGLSDVMEMSFSKVGEKYLVVQLHIKNINHRDTLETMVASGYLDVDPITKKVPDFISLEATVNSRLAVGDIQK